MAELLLELYSEEIPPQLQINARNQLKILIESSFRDKGIKFKNIEVFDILDSFKDSQLIGPRGPRPPPQFENLVRKSKMSKILCF